ncbi:1,2-phenylacetyl-CoA epoxidase subunit PaaC [Ottowia sp.]|uniref:1,2-phenylacetyl-CoA epoxidase subunit PaaC n=1 Tax=Ottowia sp. TaxID=1898956 RepID=UPI002CCA4291|nr:1,2-phenylacetyl-CoA epoxidase subunit PaaC [Ottowia sp.]HOB66133.1 phenylacetate-CoA oxygenase subunit PaaC [Ottowia sp.]HPZ57150.1 phenylacetate-CoA oxygenase subunit PaaC [Ottowia sp.]HQD47146.1 phenylacetate-CoA oxygenase subunit PaaC [Ottowia sp.]
MDARVNTHAPVEYLLHLADNAVVLGQRNAEWCGHAPVIEEDMAMANNSLDLIGQARLLYQYAAERMNADVRAPRSAAWPAGAITEDTLAYFRDVPDFRNYVLLELPHSAPLVPSGVGDRDWSTTIVRNFLYSALMVLVWERLSQSTDAQLAAIAAKSLKEVRYHLRHSRDWLVRLGDGTDESKRRTQAALDWLLPFTEEFWTASALESAVADNATGVEVASLRGEWDALVSDAIAEATLTRPAPVKGYVHRGKTGVHSEHLGYLLGEMQSLARQHPGAVW